MRKIALSAIVALCLPVFANAATTTTFVPVASGVFDNPGDGFTTFAMRVTSDASDWTNADLDINLTTGGMVQITGLFGAAEPGPQNLGDTAVFAPLNTNGDLTSGPFGGAALTVAGGPGGPFVESATDFEASWGTTFTGDTNRTFDIAMITLSPDAEGTLLFRTISGAEVEDGGISGGPALFGITGGQIVALGGIVPEPGTLALAGLALIGVASTRRRS